MAAKTPVRILVGACAGGASSPDLLGERGAALTGSHER